MVDSGERLGGAILVVEDDQEVRATFADLLAAHGYDVLQAEDGAQGLRAVKTHEPTLILLDLHMPYMSGAAFRAVQRRLPKKFSDIPVVIVSGAEDGPEECARMGVADYLSKPVDSAALMRAVKSHCRPTPEPRP